MSSRDKAGLGKAQVDTDSDRYPTFGDAMRQIVATADVPEGPIERIEVTFLASGEATYRVWAARAEEPQGGYLPGPELS